MFQKYQIQDMVHQHHIMEAGEGFMGPTPPCICHQGLTEKAEPFSVVA